jgi:hypothetical protein
MDYLLTAVFGSTTHAILNAFLISLLILLLTHVFDRVDIVLRRLSAHSSECLIDIVSEFSNINILFTLSVLSTLFEFPSIETLPSISDIKSIDKSTTFLIGTKKCLYCD